MDIYELYLSGLSCKEIADKCSMSQSTVRRRMIKAGIMRSIKDAIKLSVERGVFSQNRKGIKRPPISDETRKKMSDSKIALNKGRGWRITSTGYIEITKGENKGRLEHVVKMELLIGRRLFSNECVHHKDGNRKNNEISNLELMTRSKHASHHAKENSQKRIRDNKGRYI